MDCMSIYIVVYIPLFTRTLYYITFTSAFVMMCMGHPAIECQFNRKQLQKSITLNMCSYMVGCGWVGWVWCSNNGYTITLTAFILF